MILWNMSCCRFNTPLRSMIFFFVQINFFNVFMYAYISDNDKQVSKVLSNLLKISITFGTVWCHHPFKFHYYVFFSQFCTQFLFLGLKKMVDITVQTIKCELAVMDLVKNYVFKTMHLEEFPSLKFSYYIIVM